MKVLTNLDLNLNEIQNGKFHLLATEPTSGVKGQFYYNTTINKLFTHNGTEWVPVGDGVKSVKATSAETVINVDNTDIENPKLSFKINDEQGEGITLTQEVNGLKTVIQDGTTAQKGIVKLDSTPSATEETTAATPKGANITLTKQATAEDGMVATYILAQGGVDLDTKINIPLDYLVKKAELKTCTTDDDPVVGYKKDDKYIDFTINVKSGTTADEHLYINVKDLCDIYTGKNGVKVNSDNSIEIDNTITEQTTSAVYAVTLTAQGIVNAVGNAQKITKKKVGTIAVGDTSVKVATTTDQEVLEAFALDSDGSKLCVDIAAATDGVTFSISAAYTNAITCVVVYRDTVVE